MTELMGQKPVFLLGLGAQKAGTTWLYRYLQNSDGFVGGFAKEYHIWDAIDIDVMRHYRCGLRDRLAGGKKAKRYQLQKHPMRYFDYFESLTRDGAKIVADVTPSYSGLEEERLSFIENHFAQRDIEARAVILIRDPLSRMKSAVRSNLGKKNHLEGVPRGETDFGKALWLYAQSDACRLRTSYELTIERALRVFGPDRTYVGVFETMFQEAEIARLSAFCNVPSAPQMAQVYVNKRSGDIPMDPALDEKIIAAYKATYDYCHDAFPLTRELWSR